jgi:hypothetical protein
VRKNRDIGALLAQAIHFRRPRDLDQVAHARAGLSRPTRCGFRPYSPPGKRLSRLELRSNGAGRLRSPIHRLSIGQFLGAVGEAHGRSWRRARPERFLVDQSWSAIWTDSGRRERDKGRWLDARAQSGLVVAGRSVPLRELRRKKKISDAAGCRVWSDIRQSEK